MNATPYLHLLWKEYRAIRAFWLSLVLLVMGTLWLTMALSTDASYSRNMVYSLALGAPAFFALGAAGTAFALEQEEGTFDFLRAAPVSARQVLTSKLGLTFLATVAMLLVLVPVAWRLSGGQLPEPQVLRGMLSLWLLAAIEAIAWGAFFSLLTARPLTAICLALVAVTTTVHLLAWNSWTKSNQAYELAPYLAVAPRRALLAGLLLAVDVLLGLRWLSDAEPATRSSWKSWNFRRFRRKPDIAVAARDANSDRKMVESPDRSAIRSRLSWQHWRQSRRLMLLMGGLQIVATLVVLNGGLQEGGEGAIVPFAAMAALAGACVFLPDQEKRNYRFFVEHSVPPRSVWLSRQVPWMATVTFSTFVACLFWLYLRRHTSETYILPPIVLGLWFVAISYAAGQWMSMFVRSGLLAGFFGLLLAGLLCGWAYMMNELHVPRQWSVLPIPLVLLAATWLRAPDWIAENTRWSARLRAAAIVLVPTAAIMAAAINHRVKQVPEGPLDFNVAQYEAGMTEASRETAAMYRRADELLVFDPEGHMHLEDNAESLALLVEAGRRESCTLDDPRRSSDEMELNHALSLVQLMLSSAGQLERDGNLDAALDRYFETLHVISHWQQHKASRSKRNSGADFVEMVLRRLVAWSTQPGQTPERIKGAIERLSAVDNSMLHIDDGLKSNHILVRRALDGDPSELAGLIGERPGLTMHLLRLRLPWEKTREVRLLKQSTHYTLRGLESVRDKLSRGEEIVGYLPRDDWRPYTNQLRPDHWLSNYVWAGEASAELAEFEERRRATLLLLAIEAYRLEHGELPAELSELAGVYLAEVPLDPYSGRDFLYFPEGIPKPASDIDAIALFEAQRLWQDMETGKPGIWSTGPDIYAETWLGGGWQLDDQPPAQLPPKIIQYLTRQYSTGHRLPLYEALARGRWFAIPEPMK